jgi:hypothetical protein
MVPPGLADSESNRPSLSSVSILNYAHLGTCFRLAPFRAPYYRVNSFSFHQATRIVVVKEGKQGTKASSRVDVLEQAGWNPLRFALTLMPAPFFNHCESIRCRRSSLNPQLRDVRCSRTLRLPVSPFRQSLRPTTPT